VNSKLTPGGIAILVSGVVILLGSILDFFEDSDPAIFGEGLFPLTTLVVACGVVMAVFVALRAFSSVALPTEVLGFSLVQVHLILAGLAILIMVGYLGFDGTKAAGFFLMLLGSAGLLGGAIFLMKDEGTLGTGGTPGYGSQPPTQF
jgi:hypothetical protein